MINILKQIITKSICKELNVSAKLLEATLNISRIIIELIRRRVTDESCRRRGS